MANYSITISNSINAFGPAPSTNWGTGTPYNMTWGSSKWGEGTQDLMISFIKRMSEVISSDSTVIKSPRLVVQNSIASVEDLSSERKSDGNGYTYLFTGNASNAENRVMTTYSSAAAGSSTYSSQSAGTTNWS